PRHSTVTNAEKPCSAINWSRLPKSLARYLRTPSTPAINRSTKLSTTIVTSARSTGSSPIGRLGSTVTTRSRYRVRAASVVGALRDRKEAELDLPDHSMTSLLKRGSGAKRCCQLGRATSVRPRVADTDNEHAQNRSFAAASRSPLTDSNRRPPPYHEVLRR